MHLHTNPSYSLTHSLTHSLTRLPKELNKRDHDLLASIEERLEVAKKEDWPTQLFELKRGQVMRIEEAIDVDRQKAVKFDTLKFE